MRRLHDPRTAFVGVLIVALVWLAASASFLFVCDDAFITFRYAKNWASGEGLGFNPGEAQPVEGYSNFLWLALAAGFEAVGVAPAGAMPLVSLVLGAVLLLDVFRTLLDRADAPPWAALVGVATLALAPGFVIWGTSGLETMAEAWLLWRTVDGFAVSEREGAVGRTLPAALALALVRTEGIAWVAVAAVLGLVARAAAPRRGGDGVVRLVGGLGAVGSGFGAYFVARWLHFGTLLSNTATAKVEADPDRLARGLDYVVAYALEALAFPVHLLIVPVAVAVGGVRGLVWGALAVGVPLFAVVVGGDFMTMGRLLVPGLAFQAACVALVLGALARAPVAARVTGALAALAALAVAAVGALPLADVQLVDETTRRAFRVRFNSPVYRTELGQWRYMKANAVQWQRLGRALGEVTEPGESIVLGAVGAASYGNGLFVYDRYGLVTREVALHDGGGRRRHSPGHDKAVPVTFFLDEQPTYLSAELARAGGLRAAGQALLAWRDPRVRAGWAPEIRPTRLDGEDVYVVLLARHPRPGPVWEGFALTLEEAVKAARGR